MQIEVVKAKILKGNLVEITYEQTDAQGVKTEFNMKSSKVPHNDFINAMNKMRVHGAVIAEYIAEKEIIDISDPVHDKLDLFSISGFTITGRKAEDEAIIITGLKTLRTGKKMMFNTPLVRLNDESANAYEYVDDLVEKLADVKSEAAKYIGGKFAPDPQQSLFENEKPVTKALIDPVPPPVVEMTKKSGKGVRKVPQTAEHRDGEVANG